MKYMRSARDRVRIRVTSANIWGSIRLLNDHSIPVFHVRQEDDLTFSFEINRKHFSALRALLEKRGDRIALVQKTFLHAVQQSILQRPVLYMGLFLFFAISLLLPTRILVVEVEGNQIIPTRKILEAADEAGIKLFTPCAQVRSEKMKNALLSAIPELQWAGINTYGCKAVISVQERAAAEPLKQDSKMVSSIIADRDGIIQSFTALQGTAQCREGQAVKKGQILISGYTDCGICIRADRAQGEVYAQTLRTVQTVTPSSCQTREQQREQRRYTIILGKKRINLWKDSGIWDSSCGRISREYRLTLPGGFTLPVSIACETLSWYSEAEENVDEETARDELIAFSQNYLSDQMIAGTVSYADEVMETKPGVYLLNGQYICTEMIGRERLENGAQHEQSD
ncbi:MAG: sporulation protein YqfD [Faecousia sp.]